MPAQVETKQTFLEEIEQLGTKLDSDEREFRVANKMMRSIIEHTPLGIIVCDCAGRFRVWNKTAQELIKKGPEDLAPEDWPKAYQLYEARDHEQLVAEAPLATALRTGEVVHEVLWVGNGSQRYIECTAEPVLCDEQELIGAVVYLQGVEGVQ